MSVICFHHRNSDKRLFIDLAINESIYYLFVVNTGSFALFLRKRAKLYRFESEFKNM